MSTTLPTRQTAFEYDRTVVAFHGTYHEAAQKLVAGVPFGRSENDDDWLGHGIYFWEFAPQQAWWWANQRYGDSEAAVVGALIRLGRCLDLLDPYNTTLLHQAHDEFQVVCARAGLTPRQNANKHKYLDCGVFNYFFEKLAAEQQFVESTRAVFVPMVPNKGLNRLWDRSGVFSGAHIQLSIREPNNILAVWSVRRDGRYGKD